MECPETVGDDVLCLLQGHLVPMDFADNFPEEECSADSGIFSSVCPFKMSMAKDIVHELRHCNTSAARNPAMCCHDFCELQISDTASWRCKPEAVKA